MLNIWWGWGGTACVPRLKLKIKRDNANVYFVPFTSTIAVDMDIAYSVSIQDVAGSIHDWYICLTCWWQMLTP